MSSVFHYRSPCREASPPFVINKPPVNEQLKDIRLAVLLVFFVSLFALWSLNPVKLSAETLYLHTLFLHASAAGEAGATRDEALGGETLRQQYSPAEGDDGEAPNAVQHVHSGKAPPGEGDGQERTDFFDESNDVTWGMTKPQTKSPIVPISGMMPGVAGAGEGEVLDPPDQTEPSAPQPIISVSADASESAVADTAATPDASASVPPSASLAVSSPLPLVAFAQISAYPSATVLPSVTASFPGSFNSLASVAVPSLLTDTLASFPLFSTVVERKKLAGSSCIGVNGCNNTGSRSINTGSSSSSGPSSSSNGCGGVPCALEVLSLLDSTSAMEWPLMPSVVLQGIGKTVDKVVRGFVLRTAVVLPNIKRNVIISYKGYKPFKLLEMLQLRNHFLEQLSAFFYSLQPLRSIYLRHLGMEIFELPDVLGIADFIRAALGLRQYVEHVYEDQELADFDWEPAETAENEEAFPWVAAPSTFPLRDVPHNHSAKNLPRQKKQSGTGSSTGGVDTSGHSAVGPVSAERLTSEMDKTGAGGGISHKEERKDEAAKHGDAASTADGERAPPRRLQVMPNDPLTWRQWPISDNGRLRWGTEAPKAWEIWNGSRLPESITVAVIDSGVNYNHPDLRNMIWTNPDEICNNGIDDDRNGLVDDCIGWDFINGDNDPDDDNGHGTASAGIIAAEPNNNIGMAGICWKCKIMSLKALNQNIKGTVSSFARAIDYALGKGVKISNNSYGGRGSGFHGLEQAVVRARAAGMIFVAAAGNYNGNNDNDRDPVYPASYPLDNIVSVAAITRAGTLANFSSYGRTQVDIAAPGAQIMSTSLHGTYRTLDGTSFAVPFVTGAVALIWSRFPQLTYQEVIARILRNAKPNPHLQGYIATSGVIDIWKALTNGADTLSSPAPPFSALPHPPPPSPIQPLPPQFSCGNLICHPVASCVISAEGPLCQCPTGYEGSGVECRDIDECTFNPCGPASVCKNLPGSFECLCREGFRQVGDTCVDINECAEGVLDEDGKRNQIACPAVALCQNFSGSFDCICPPRSLWNGKSGSKAQCLTLNIPITGPCVDNGGCGINALCQASGSAWYHQRTCTCVEGYEKFGSNAQSAMHLRQIQLLGDGRDACIRKGLLELEISRYLSLWEVFFWPKLGATVPPQVPKDTGSPVSPRDEDLGGAAAVQQISELPRPAPAGLTAAASSTPGLSAAALQEGRPNAPTSHVKTVNIVEEVTGHSSTLSSSRGSAPALREILPAGGSSAISSSNPVSVNNTSTAADEANSSRLASNIVGSFYAAAGWLRPRGPSVTVYNQALTCFLGLCLLGGAETTGIHQAV